MGPELELPCPRVVLPADYRARLERSTARVAAALERREGAGASDLAGAGLEFAGFRPYRAGDDPRTVDWNVYARLGTPWVRIARREARERWLVLVDASASMGVGPPGKLQRAAEVAGALVALGLRRGAEVELAPIGTGGGGLVLARRRPGALSRACAELERWRAEGADDARGLAAHARAIAECSRLFLLGDPFALRPEDAFAGSAGTRARHVLHFLAPIELACPPERSVEWRDPERERAQALELDGRARADYAVELERRLERWRTSAQARGARHGAWSTTLPFEDVVRSALGA
jgi:uncharacterized protein (DUF58 family)